MTVMLYINCPITPAVPACLSDPVRLTKGNASVPVSRPAKKKEKPYTEERQPLTTKVISGLHYITLGQMATAFVHHYY